MKQSTIRSLFIIAAALFICLGCFVAVPAGSVPLIIQDFLAVLVACTLGGLNGAGAVGIYIVCGTAGLPVFAGLHGGIAYLSGPAGGFITGSFIASMVSGLIAGTPFTFERKFSWKNYGRIALAALLGYTLVALTGTIWYHHVLSETDAAMTFAKAVSDCIIPSLPVYFAKLALTIPLAAFIRPRAAKRMYSEDEEKIWFDTLKKKMSRK